MKQKEDKPVSVILAGIMGMGQPYLESLLTGFSPEVVDLLAVVEPHPERSTYRDELEDRKIPSGRDFDPATGKLKDPALLLLDEKQALAWVQRLHQRPCRVAAVDDKPYSSKPYPPFTTSTLQQEANRKYGFTARNTMQVAQSLYENGHITYMRTDSTSMAAVAIV